jgi:hypothetical protein
MDRCKNRAREKSGIKDDEDEEGSGSDGDDEEELARKMAKSALRILAKKKGDRFVIECVTGGLSKIDSDEKNKVQDHFKRVLSVDSLDTVDIHTLLDALKAENINERIAIRKANAFGAGKRERDQSKIMVTQL